MRKNKIMQIGVIGCGYWGPNFIRIFNQLKNTTVKYACDLNPLRLLRIKNLYPHIITTPHYLEVLQDVDIDAVVVATPVTTHYKIVKDAISFDKHTLVEKPISMHINEAQELIRMAKANQKILMVGHTFKFNPGIRKLKWLIDNNKLGNIYYIYSRRTNLGPLRKDVNAMWDLAPHDISIVSYLLDSQPLDVTARGQRFLEHALEDVVFITLTYPENIFVHLHVSWLDPRKVREITVVGSKKMAVFNDLNTELPISIYDKSVMKKKFKQDYDSFREFQMIVKDGKVTTPQIKKKEPLLLECSHFVDCIIKNNTPLTDGEDGLEVLKVLRALQVSLSSNGVGVALNTLDPVDKEKI